MSRVIAIANQKGGVGKTTTAINLGASLAVAERKTLIIDIDPQANASSGLGLDRKRERANIYDVLVGSETLQAAIVEAAMPTAVVASVLATEFNSDAKMVSSIIVLSTLLSILTLPFVILWVGY